MTVVFLFEGLDEQIDEVVRVGRPSFQTVGRLEAILRRGFLDTQARVHVDTGHLKASGTTESDFDGLTWEGAIYYGVPGDAHWWRDPSATYAIFEMARGGSHNFFGGLPSLHDEYMAVIAAHLRGDE